MSDASVPPGPVVTAADESYRHQLVAPAVVTAHIDDDWAERSWHLVNLGDGWVLASETCALDIMGATYIRDVRPGEVLKLRHGKVESLRPLPPVFRHSPCIFELVYFARPDSRL